MAVDVYDPDDNYLYNANVEASWTNGEVEVRDNGRTVVFKNPQNDPPGGEYTLTASLDGYQTETETAPPGAMTHIVLQPEVTPTPDFDPEVTFHDCTTATVTGPTGDSSVLIEV